MKKLQNISIPNQPLNILADLYYKEQNSRELVVFCHGFKGFKDWGAWHLVAEAFADAGFIFLKFNFSQNGIGLTDHQNFTRLELFEQNNYSKEMEDLHTLIEWTKSNSYKEQELPTFDKIFVVGHSRGGGIALLSAFENEHISKVATWASIANFDRFGSLENLAKWKAEGTKNFYNSRTNQDMKIAYQFYEDFDLKRARFDLERVATNLNKPVLLIHGKEDDAVGFSHAQRLKNWHSAASLVLIEEANHVFGAKHPFLEKELPLALKETVVKTIEFFREVDSINK